MTEGKSATKGGLDGVVVADSSICKIDGRVGELRYAGYLIKDLAEHVSFLEATLLLLDGELPDRLTLDRFTDVVHGLRELPEVALEVLRMLAHRQAPMDCLRTVVSAMSAADPTGDDDDLTVHRQRGVGLIARLPTILAAYSRLRNGHEPIAPRDDLDHAANFLWMLNGVEPAADEARMFDVCLVLHAEHAFNASTFSARVTAATLSDMYSAITSAIGTLKGPLHGGANTAVMSMLMEIGNVDRVEGWLTDLFDRGEKVMGFGHRVYKVVDPRALILKDFARQLARVKSEPRWFEMSERIERIVADRKGIDMNVDFYSASTYHYMGIPADLFTGIFAISRISGWVAHVLEQLSNNRLIRPTSNYTGPAARECVPIAQRG